MDTFLLLSVVMDLKTACKLKQEKELQKKDGISYVKAVVALICGVIWPVHEQSFEVLPAMLSYAVVQNFSYFLRALLVNGFAHNIHN